MIAILYDKITKQHTGFFPDYTPDIDLHCPFILVEDITDIPQELMQPEANTYHLLEIDENKLVGFTEFSLPPQPGQTEPTTGERINQLEAENATLKSQVNELTILVGDLILSGGV
ncbi:bZIP transcription factor [Gorillibacterium sp. sgz5001074]|uniref:bZIP transcription factor n=1 Tax=Gorillibacterium sp. sgz5001074 TaxID=3446695 RepID=UPI003F6617E1